MSKLKNSTSLRPGHNKSGGSHLEAAMTRGTQKGEASLVSRATLLTSVSLLTLGMSE